MHPAIKIAIDALFNNLLSEPINMAGSVGLCLTTNISAIRFKWQYKEIQADNLGSSSSIQHFESFKRPINKF
jgi:hypothetical protein